MVSSENWISCEVCDEEYHVVAPYGPAKQCKWCPFCGSEVEHIDDDIEEDDVEEIEF